MAGGGVCGAPGEAAGRRRQYAERVRCWWCALLEAVRGDPCRAVPERYREIQRERERESRETGAADRPAVQTKQARVMQC